MALLITMMGKTEARKKMIKEALKEKAPKMYQQLMQQGQLPIFLSQKEKAMMEDYEQASEAAAWEWNNIRKDKSVIEDAQELEMMDRQAWEETILNHLEFQDETEGMTIE